MRFLFYLVVVGCLCVVVVDSNPPSCTTPNGEKALCVLLFSCPILQEAVASKDPMVQKFVQASGCGDGQFMVCCGTSGNFTNPSKSQLEHGNSGSRNETKESHRNFVIEKLLPKKTYCGMQHTDDYFYNETETSVDEFPWLVYIPLTTYMRRPHPGIEQKCAGVLISNQYALTTTDCASKRFDSVKVGLYHKHQNVSCIRTLFNEDDCTDPATEVKVAQRFRFEDKRLLLLRFENKIRYSDYVRPICLPLEESSRAQIGDTIVTSGWGEEDYFGKTVTIKKRIKHTLTRNEDCTDETFPPAFSMCVVTPQNGTGNNYVCDGDDGGPFMYKHRNNWFVEGIIDLTLQCTRNKPVRGEKINAESLDWIFEKMQP